MMTIPLRSSNLRGLDYNPNTATLTVIFRNASAYLYFRVPPKIVHGLLKAESHGGFFHQHIRDRFSYRRIK
jgi:hypothetical protein